VQREGPVLFDLDGENERSAFIVSNQRWTILFYSHWEEERRLIRALQAEGAPLLYVWVHDSDVWGYDLFHEQGFAGSFNSNPRAHQSFADEELGSRQRPTADPDAVCRMLDLPLRGRDLRRIERRRSAFKEDVCRQFCRLLGAEAAVSGYDDLEGGALSGLEGWHSEQLVFRMDLETLSGEIDLSRHSLMTRKTMVGLVPYKPVEFPPELLAEMERMRQRVRRRYQLLRPLSWLARGWRRLYEATSPRDGAGPPAALPAAPPNFRIEDADLVNDRHRCRITPAAGARSVSVSSKPSAVFGFRIGETQVICTARRLSKIDEVLRQPSGSRVLCDDKYTIAERNARHLLFELPPGFVAGSREPFFLEVYVIQTERALYVFLHRYRNQLAPETAAAIQDTVDSFRLIP
jgi:hypothetical protein